MIEPAQMVHDNPLAADRFAPPIRMRTAGTRPNSARWLELSWAEGPPRAAHKSVRHRTVQVGWMELGGKLGPRISKPDGADDVA